MAQSNSDSVGLACVAVSAGFASALLSQINAVSAGTGLRAQQTPAPTHPHQAPSLRDSHAGFAEESAQSCWWGRKAETSEREVA